MQWYSLSEIHVALWSLAAQPVVPLQLWTGYYFFDDLESMLTHSEPSASLLVYADVYLVIWARADWPRRLLALRSCPQP